ncbi:1,4-alpha-glucan branching protein GlgB [Paraliomyxa miuraensis]|uniref:1,4-alpha-glucan branching protein GlgB n=1 Tax=Paraliomyxa miuraensis TaxID=376150 RepID=UPI002257EC8E|nr:1,4-alpha-glucan branching protein GlgB [Paraliomyxa miuraensis]MCX4241032.1 1,4-alpha-glucan branching protein GlgB [Paraliomyxa miuraensis]
MTPFTRLGGDDLHLFNEGSHHRLYRHLGAHLLPPDVGEDGTYFAVWAPNAARVSVVGDFNAWSEDQHVLHPRAESGIWEGVVPGVGHGALYKYAIVPHGADVAHHKADPMASFAEVPPRTASVVWDLAYQWHDHAWMATRGAHQALTSPMSIYEVHLGSWRRTADGRMLGYRELAPLLAQYVRDMGFSHVELMPLTEHPFYGSWGYQTTGYFAPTSRYGTPQELMALVDTLHQAGIGVILDWVPSHFPGDEHGLVRFDGTHLYEHADPRQGFQPDWTTHVFNFGRHEVRCFLISSALHWLERYHVDALRVDAVASMLYLDYSRAAGQWVPNRHGGRENLEAIEFLRALNREIYRSFPDVQTIAEESTAWPMVSRPTYLGGLGFGLKWDMGWMHDTLRYLSLDPIHRAHHHDALTFRMIYAWNENFVLPLSHDEVVHGKGSLLGRMPGDDWQRFANLRLLLCYLYAQPGKKLLFMGGELAQPSDWDHEQSLPWHLLAQDAHAGVQRMVRDLNRLYRQRPALHEQDTHEQGFSWVDASDWQQSCLTFLRHDGAGGWVSCAFNFTPVPRHNYRVGVPVGGPWDEVFNSDAQDYGGSGQGNLGGTEATPVTAHGHARSLSLTLPPLGAVMLAPRAP